MVVRYRTDLPKPAGERKAKVQTATAEAHTDPTRINIGETMIGTEPLCEILETTLFSAHLTNAIPISLMLIGPSGAGKSKLVMQYQHAAGCHVTTDVTSMGLQELLAKDSSGKVHFIIIPDFNLVLSHRHSTLQLTIGNLLSMTSEGTIRIDDGRAIKETKHNSIGIISAMTRDMYAGIGKKWIALGFNRRFLPINYDYSLKTREQVQRSIAMGKTTMLHLSEKRLVIPASLIDVQISDGNSNRISTYSNELATNIGWVGINSRNRGGRKQKVNGEPVQKGKQIAKQDQHEFRPRAIFTGKQIEFSPHIVLRTLARAHALRSNREMVNEDDLEFLMKVIQFTRFDQPVQL